MSSPSAPGFIQADLTLVNQQPAEQNDSKINPSERTRSQPALGPETTIDKDLKATFHAKKRMLLLARNSTKSSIEVMKSCCANRIVRWLLIVFGVFLVGLAIFIPLFLKYALPVIISKCFANNNCGSAGTAVLQLLQISSLDDVSNGDVVGFAQFSVNATQSGYSIPFNVPITLGPSMWTMSVAVSSQSNDLGYLSTTATFYPLASVFIGTSFLKSGVFSLNQQNILLNLTTPAEFLATNRNLTSPTPKVYPLGAYFIKSTFDCLMSGNPVDGPTISIESNVDIWVGSIFLPTVNLKTIISIRNILKYNGITFASVTKQTASDPTDSFQVHITNISTSPDITARLTLNLPSNHYSINPLSMSLKNFNFRMNVSSIPVLDVNAPKVQAVQGTPNITTFLKMKELGNIISDIGGILLTPSNQWNLGFDQVSVQNAEGKYVAWVSDILDAIWVQIPFAVLGDSSQKDVGNIIKGLGV